MDIPYLINLLQNKLNYLSNARTASFNVGDLNGTNNIDQEILATQNTLAQLNLLSSISQAAIAANISPADVVSNAVSNTQNQSQAPNISAIVDGYDISNYATDPQYQDKIKSILNSMPIFKDVATIDSYIQTLNPSSPVTGTMVMTASNTYNIDIPLLIAIMQNDSNFGTAGVGARTFNPGNVGNTGTEEHTYASWQDGVSAVAQWLNNHRVVNTPVVIAPVLIKPITPDTATTTTPVATSTQSTSTTPIVIDNSTSTATSTITSDIATSAATSTQATSTIPIVIDNSTSTATSTIQDTATSTLPTSTSTDQAATTTIVSMAKKRKGSLLT